MADKEVAFKVLVPIIRQRWCALADKILIQIPNRRGFLE